MKITKANIWLFAQNKPTLIVKDLCKFVSPDIIYNSLLKRGVFKWLSVRRDLIKLKDTWKERIKGCEIAKASYKEWGDIKSYHKMVGYQNCLEECRKEIRKLCHSERFVAPDFDRKAKEYLEKIKEAK